MSFSAASEAVPSVIAGKTQLKVEELTDFSMDPEATVLASADAQRGAVCVWKLSQGWKEAGSGAPLSLQNMTRLPRACSVEWHEPFTLATATGDNNAYLVPNTQGAKHVALVRSAERPQKRKRVQQRRHRCLSLSNDCSFFGFVDWPYGSSPLCLWHPGPPEGVVRSLGWVG